MTAFLDVVGPVIWRATWQGTALALAVMLLLSLLGERMAPRWRYLLWSVVLLRFLCLTTPAAPFSAFNLLSRQAAAVAARDVPHEAPPQTIDARESSASAPRQASADVGEDRAASPVARPAEVAARAYAAPTPTPATIAGEAQRPAWQLADVVHSPLAGRAIWLAGVLLSTVHLAVSAAALRRRLSSCRPVTDAAILALLAAACGRIGRKRLPELLVTPAAISPCIAGVLCPRIIVPETLAAGDAAPLKHVLAHELAHLVRGDLWTNWLLLAARTLHWFNPVVWLTIRELQAEREAACDELALAALGEADRPAYAASLVELATNLAPSALAPAMIGIVSSAGRLRARVERLLRAPSISRIRAPLAAACLLAVALPGLTDAMPAAEVQDERKTSARPSAAEGAGDSTNAASDAKPVTLRGRCIDRDEKSPMAGVRVRLFKAAGRTAPIVEAANTVTDDQGEFAFADLAPPRDTPAHELIYLLFAEADHRPIGVGGTWTASSGEDPSSREIHFLRDSTTFSGTVLDANRQPVPGAHVAQWDIDGRPVPGVLSATTDADGRFEIKRIPDFSKIFQREHAVTFTVSHPDYPMTDVNVPRLPADIAVILSEGCLVTGTVFDRVTGKPAEGAVVVADNGKGRETPAATGRDGTFRLPLVEGRYTFRVDAKDRVCVALTDRECLAGEPLDLPPLELIAGGFISGRVINTATGKPVAESDGRPIMLGLTGPTHPRGKVISPARLATADANGRFSLRAAPGENFPYFVNIHGDRMAWDTLKQPPVIVKEGQTTEYDMLITPEIPASEKLAAARKLVAALPAAPDRRADRILLEFRKLSHTVDEEELWCTLMRELVALGPAVVPQICDELDRTKKDVALRRLAFALRAIGDRRAVPALVRALPKTLLPPSSGYGLLVDDADLTAFMQQHDLGGNRGAYFDVGRPVREVSGALAKLTGQTFDDAELFGIFLSEDPRRQVLQRRMFQRQAQRWQAWWESHWREFVDDAAYQKVKLEIVEEPLPAASKTLSAKARLVDGTTGAILSPAKQGGEHADHFCDLDTGYQPRWPTSIAKDEARLDGRLLGDWAAEKGVDLMCITHVAADGTETFVLRGFGLEAWEISPRDLRNLDKFIAAGKLPEGRPVGDLLMHYDEESRQLAPAADAAFIYLTREGSLGVIEITDRVVKTENAGGFGQWPRGVGFFLGVRYNLKTIVP